MKGEVKAPWFVRVDVGNVYSSACDETTRRVQRVWCVVCAVKKIAKEAECCESRYCVTMLV